MEGRETIIWIDDAIGALLNKLEETGELDNTVIFFFNDHGQTAKGSVYQGGAYNPSLVWRHDGWPAGNESEALVSNIDFAPTMLSLAGAGRPDYLQGRVFMGPGKDAAPQYLFGHRDRMDETVDIIRTVTGERYKYIRNFHDGRPYLQPCAYKDKKPILVRAHFQGGAQRSERSALA